MKKIFSIIILLSLATSSVCSQQVQASGKIEGIAAETVLYVSRVEGNQVKPVDTLRLDKHNGFAFKAEVASPTLFLMNFSTLSQTVVHIMLEPKDKVELTMRYDDTIGYMHIASCKGSENVKLYQKFNDALYRHGKMITALNNEYGKASEKRREELGPLFEQVQANQDSEVRKLLSDNSNVLMGAFLVTYFESKIESHIDIYEKIYESLKAQYGDNQFVRYVGSKVANSIIAGRMAPDIVMTDPYGKERKLSDLRGKVVMIDFWASWCRPCRMENPNVVKLYKQYHDKGFEIYSVSLDRNRDDWMRAIEQDGLEWENHVSDLNGWTSSGGATYGIRSVPSTVLIDREGRIIARNLRGHELANRLKEIFE